MTPKVLNTNLKLLNTNMRSLKIESIHRKKGQKPFSKLRLKGKWLTEAGFPPESQVNIIVESGKIIIVPK